MDEFLTKLGDEAAERPDPTLAGAVVAAGAVLATAGLLVIALDKYDGDTSIIGIAFGLLVIAAGYVILLKLEPHVRPAAMALIALGTAQTLGFVFDDLDSPSLLLALLAVAYLAQWGWSPARGSTILATLGLFSLWAFLIDAAQSDTPSQGTFVDETFGLPSTGFTSGDDTVSYLSLIIGGLLLFGAHALDRAGGRGVATSAVVVGDIAFVVGVFGVVGTFESDVFGSLLIIIAGLILAFVGSGGDRRFTTWLGSIGIFSGLVALLTTAFDFEDAVEFGIVALFVGAAVIAAIAVGGGDRLRSSDPDESASQPEQDEAAPQRDAPMPLPAEPAPKPEAEQGWHADPTGRHELRWHDGTSWTANISDHGETSTDEGV